MIQSDVAVGNLSSLYQRDVFIVMAFAAFKALHLVLACFRPEAPPLISGIHQNNVVRERYDCIHTLFIIKGLGCVFVGFLDTVLSRIHGPARKGEHNYHQP